MRTKSAVETVNTSGSTRQAGCFGKLPIQPEYIKHNVAHPEVRMLDQWLQQGIGLAARHTLEAEVPSTWLHHGVIGGTDEMRPVLVSLRPSQDQSGRRFPFVIFELPGTRERESSAGRLSLCSEAFFNGATSVMTQPWQREPLSTVLAWVDGIGEVPRLPARTGVGDLGAQRLLEQLVPQVPSEWRLPYLERTTELLRQVERRTAPRVGWGLRLPLSAEEPLLGISWWLRLAESVLGHRSWRPCYFWRACGEGDDHGGELLLFFRMPPAQLVTYLLERRGLEGTVINPADEISRTDEQPLETRGLTTAQSLLEHLLGGARR